MRKSNFSALAAAFFAATLSAQEPNPTQTTPASEATPRSSPLYRVNVVARTTQAVNYGHNDLSTKIDFGGTVFMPEAEGKADVRARKGVVEIDAKFKNLPSPQKFGDQYLTYVLWAITPQGRATSLGELMTSGSHKAKIETSTELQTFALLVTAEPYYAVTQPSDLVVMENIVRRDTRGTTQTVEAQYELLKRGESTFDVTAARERRDRPAKMVSKKEHEALSELYQARNAVGWAEHNQAERYAPDTLAKARGRLEQAERAYERNPKGRDVVTFSREAAQTAEDARLISLRRQEAEQSGAAAREENAVEQTELR